MKKLILTAMLAIFASLGAQAMSLFPFFVDIAPDYEDGTHEEFKDVDLECILYHSTAPGSYPASYSEVISFFRDTLPEGAKMEESMLGDRKLLIVSSGQPDNDTMGSSTLFSAIYVLRLTDDRFCAVYCECEK